MEKVREGGREGERRLRGQKWEGEGNEGGRERRREGGQKRGGEGGLQRKEESEEGKKEQTREKK